MRKLYLHVGVHRTATTSIQRFMRANFTVLLNKGYLYPYGVARHNAVVGRVRYGTMTAEDLAQDLLRRMEAKGGHVQSVVLSDEDLSMIEDMRIFASLRRHFEVKVVVSLRRQDLWLESWYLQNVKWQWDPSLAHVGFDEFFARRGEFFWIDYASRLAHYEAVFGAGAVVAGVFEEADMPLGPIDAFLAMIGISDQAGFGQKLHHNSSLSPLASEFMRHLPLDEMEGPDRRVFEQACLALDEDLVTNGSKLVMSHPRRLAVMAAHATGNAATAQRHFKRDVLFRAPLPEPEAPLANADLPGDTEGLMRDFVAPFVRTMGRQMAILRLAAADAAAEVAAEVAAAPAQNDRKRQGPKKDRVRPRT